MKGRRSIRKGGRATAAGAAAITVHGLLLIAFLASRDEVPVSEPPTFDAELVSPFPRERTRSARAKPTEPEPASVATDHRSHRPEIRPDAPRPAPAGAVVVPADQGADYAALRRALRGRVGCDRANFDALTAEERRRCVARRDTALASLDGGPAQRFDLSKRGAFQARDEVPYLARKPKNGCKVMSGGQTSVMGQEAGVVGIGCAIAF